MTTTQHIFIIGGGAAGFFSAIHNKQNHPDATVTIIEKSKHVLSKVKISGGGRCNVTHACFDPQTLCDFIQEGPLHYGVFSIVSNPKIQLNGSNHMGFPLKQNLTIVFFLFLIPLNPLLIASYPPRNHVGFACGPIVQYSRL